MGLLAPYGKLAAVADKVQSCLEKYQRFETTNPILAKTALVTASLLMSGIAGGVRGGLAGFLAGLGTGAANELHGEAVNQLAGEYISDVVGKGIEKYSPYLTKLDSTLTPQQAALLGATILAATSPTIRFASFAKNMKNVHFIGEATKNGKGVHVAYSKNGNRINVGGGLPVKSILTDKEIRVIANKIANGHAFEKHVLGNSGHIPGVSTKEELANFVEKIMNEPTAVKKLENGRIGFWHRESRMVVVHDPGHIDKGSIFKSSARYFNSKNFK